ncbi:HEAT repeat domain-containing protein [Rufibacter ruber]|uniref:HEAT repeat domain-containing protein n=1 Tax=Rufibacter ruber TaxID=1783499 RepID=UPI00082E3ADF|nr:HEAT repeat domain-containing protein [Rufibacter ruber]
MPFEQIEALLEKYYNGETSLEEENQLKEFFRQTKLLPDHLKVHAVQFEHYGQEQEVELDKFLSDDWLFEKIEQPQLQVSSAAPMQQHWFRQYSWQIAASITLLLVAFWAGNYFRQDSSLTPAPKDVAAVQQQSKAQETTPIQATAPAPENTALTTAATATEADVEKKQESNFTPSPRQKPRTVWAASTTVSASASDRLQLVTQELETNGLTPDESRKVIRQLIKTMNHDNNVNVRLAATEALYQFREQPEARKAIIQSLGNQTDPMMQVTLIEMIISLKEKTAIPHLQKLTGRDDLLPIVKFKAQEGLGTLI